MSAMDAEERSDRRRAQILAAASRVFAQQGFHRTTVRRIAQEAGIADGTIYLYFGSKQEILLALLAQLARVNERADDFAELAAADAGTFAATYLRRRLEELREWRQLFAAVMPEVLADAGLREAYRDRLAPAFAAADAELARRAGELGRLDPQLTVRVMAATVLGLLVLDLLGEPIVGARWDELAGFMADLWTNGMLPERR